MLFGRPMEDITSGQRKFSKKITFGVLYGGSVRGLAYRSGFEPNEVAAVLEVFNEEFPQLSAWLRAQREAVEFDASIATLFGRRRDLSAELNERGASDAARKAINTPIQSLASDLMLVVLREIEQQVLERDLNSYPLFGVHDSLILEVYPGEEEELLEVVQLGFEAIAETPLRDLEMFKTVPIIGEAAIGESWAAVEETNEGYGAEVTRECFSHKP